MLGPGCKAGQSSQEKSGAQCDNSAAVLTVSTSPNFSFMSEAILHKKKGGVAILFNDSIQCKQISYGNFACFEYVALQLNSSLYF